MLKSGTNDVDVATDQVPIIEYKSAVKQAKIIIRRIGFSSVQLNTLDTILDTLGSLLNNNPRPAETKVIMAK